MRTNSMWSISSRVLTATLYFLMVLLTACSKDDETPALDYNKVHMLKEVKEETESFHIVFNFSNSFKYNNDGKLVEEISIDPNGETKNAYYYINSSIIKVVKSRIYASSDTLLLELNDKGLVVTENALVSKDIIRFKYDSEGHCIYEKRAHYESDTSNISQAQIITHIYSDGNLIRDEYNTGYVSLYSYYNDKVNTLTNAGQGKPFYGKVSKNLVKVAYATDVFDSQNRLISRTTPERKSTYEYY